MLKKHVDGSGGWNDQDFSGRRKVAEKCQKVILKSYTGNE